MKPGEYVLMRITNDGPSRIQGRASYCNADRAHQAAELYLREHPDARVTIFRVDYTYWLDPNPKMFSNAPEIKDAP